MLPHLRASYHSRRGSGGSPAWSNIALYTGVPIALLILLVAYTFTVNSSSGNQLKGGIELDETVRQAGSQGADEAETADGDWSIAALAHKGNREDGNVDDKITTARDNIGSDRPVDGGEGVWDAGGGGEGGGREAEAVTEKGSERAEGGEEEGKKELVQEDRYGEEASGSLPRQHPPPPSGLELVKVIQAPVDGAGG